MTAEHVKALAQRLEKQAAVARDMLARGANQYGELVGEDEQLFDRWVNATIVIIRDNLGQHEANNFKRKAQDYSGGRHVASGARCRQGAEFIEGLVRTCREFPGQLTYTEPALSRLAPLKGGSPATENSSVTSRDVFLIHGHDERNALKLEKHLRDRHNLNSVVLSDLPGKGRTLIEKFEEEGVRAAYAFALLTPDDVVQTAAGEYAQARPNVAFELGWFYGRLGRSRVCIVLRKGTQVHSDLAGINRLEFQDSVTEVASEIEGELRAVGLIK